MQLKYISKCLLPADKSNVLFGALILSSAFVFIIGNLLLFDKVALFSSLIVTINCIFIFLIFYWLHNLFLNISLGLILTYSLLLILVYSHYSISVILFRIIQIISLIYFCSYYRVKKEHFLPILVMALISAFVVLGCLHSYTSFDMLHRVSIGYVHKDTLFHSSISAMIKNYGIVSSGLNGLVEIPYHYLSHALIAGISLLTGIGVLEVYGIAPFVLFAPLLIFSFSYFCYLLCNNFSNKLLLIIWVEVCLILMISPYLLNFWGVSDDFFVSESYEVSLPLFIFGFIFLFKNKIVLYDMLIILALTILMTLSKSSVGIIFVALWGMRIVLMKFEKLFLNLFFILTLVAVVFLILNSSAKSQINSNSILIHPFHFIENYSFLGGYISEFKSQIEVNKFNFSFFILALFSISSFFIFHFFSSWVVLIYFFIVRNKFKLWSNPLFIYTFASLIISSCIIILIAIPGGSAVYFTNLTFFISIPFIIIVLANWVFKQKSINLFFHILVIVFLAFPGLYLKSNFNPKRMGNANITDYVYQLYNLKGTSNKDIIIYASSDLLIRNPIQNCSAAVFLFPALSEMPWTGLLNQKSNCTYFNYGFGQYNIDQKTGKINHAIVPVLTSDLKITRFEDLYKQQ
jgi:hypothetical protein